MIVIVTIAIFGAVIGLSVKPAVRAVIVAALSVGALQYSAIVLCHTLLGRPGLTNLAIAIQSVVGEQLRDVVPTASTAAFAAVAAAFLSAMNRTGEERRRGRRAASIQG